MTSLQQIRKFFKDKDAEDNINTEMLLRHAIAFVGYLITTLVYYIALAWV